MRPVGAVCTAEFKPFILLRCPNKMIVHVMETQFDVISLLFVFFLQIVVYCLGEKLIVKTYKMSLKLFTTMFT